MLRYLLPLLFLVSCADTSVSGPPWQEISGRDDGGVRIVRYPVYRARVPGSWKRIDPGATDSIADTTLALITYEVDGITVVVHNFPYDDFEQRIPPQSQVFRWQRQTPKMVQIAPYAHGGFSGLSFDAQSDGKRVLGWAMQLAPQHYRNLSIEGTAEELSYFRQMRADYTIKAWGPPNAIMRHQDSIEQFARSFELIQEIPQ